MKPHSELEISMEKKYKEFLIGNYIEVVTL